MNRWTAWLAAGAIIAGIWLAVSGGVGAARVACPTAEKTLAYIESHPLGDDMPSRDRRRIVEELARRLNQLDFEERQRVQFAKPLRHMQATMTEEERLLYIDLSLPKGMKEFAEAFNRMAPETRARHLSVAMQELERFHQRNPDLAAPDISPEVIHRVIREGTTSFFRDTSAEVKMELQPLIDRAQNIVQGAR